MCIIDAFCGRLAIVFLSVWFVLPVNRSFAEFKVPALRSAVTDNAGLFSSQEKRLLESTLQNFRKNGGAQIAVLTVGDLGGLPIEMASIKVTDQWQLGDSKKDDGVLLLISKGDRKMRIEVGQGLEGGLTDAHSKRIIDQIMTPLFKQSRFGEGVFLAAEAIAGRTNPKISFRSGGSYEPRVRREKKRSNWKNILFFLLLFLFGSPFSFFRAFGGRRRGYGGGFSSGGFSSGGGGFSGGGGGFSGGGASGSW